MEAKNCFSIVQAFYSTKNQYICLPTCDVLEYRAKDFKESIIAKLGISGNFQLSIRSTTGCLFNLVDDDSPLEICPELINIPLSIDPLKSPMQYFLYLAPVKRQERVFIFNVSAVSNEGTLYYVSQNCMKYPTTDKKVLVHLSNIHGIPVEEFRIFNSYGGLYSYTDPLKFVSDILHNKVFIAFQATPKIEKDMKKRVNIFNEIISTERTYVKIIKGFDSNVGGFLKKTKVLSATQTDNLLKAADYITNLHTRLLDDLEAQPTIDYMSCFGRIFKKYIPFLKTYNSYISIYEPLTIIIGKAANDPKYKPDFDAFMATDYANGLTLESILITPIQRGPRYQLLMRDLLKVTPKKHPDYSSLSEAYTRTENELKLLETQVQLFKRRTAMFAVEKLFAKGTDVVKPDRIFINQYTLELRGKIHLFVFSDVCWFAKANGSKFEVAEQLEYSDTNIIPYAERSVLFRHAEDNRVYAMESKEVRDSLVESFREAAVARMMATSDITLRAEPVKIPEELVASHHAMDAIGSTAVILDGKGDLTLIGLDDLQMNKHVYDPASDPPARIDCAHCAYGSCMYIYGGRSGDTVLDDFWVFDLDAGGYWKIESKEGVKPPPAYGCTLSPLKKNGLLLVGGESEFFVYRFDTEVLMWTKINIRSGCPPSGILWHNLVMNGRGDGFIIGGKTPSGPVSFSYLVRRDGEVITVADVGGLQPIDRKGHVTQIVKGLAVVLGGQKHHTPFILSEAIQMWNTPRYEGEKYELAFPAATVYNDAIYVQGGVDESGQEHGGMVKFTVEAPEQYGMFFGKIEEDRPIAMMLKTTNLKDKPWTP